VTKSNVLSALAALAVLGAPAALAAQQQPAQPPAAQQVEQWIEEYQQIHGRLSDAVEQAMESQELRKEQEEVYTAVNAAMLAVHPDIERDMQRIDGLQREAAQAQQAGDQAALQRLTAEFEAIDQRMVQARQRALQTDGLAERVAAFEQRLVERMTRHEPRTMELIQRQEQLQMQIETAMQQAAQR
jgi:hypothetical protein